MNVVFLSPDFPSHYYRFCVRLREWGHTVLGIHQEPAHALKPELAASFHDSYQVPDLHRYDELVRALGYFTWRHGRIDRIDSLNEYWLETEARLRTDFNIDGIRTVDIPLIKRKSMMKEVFQRLGLSVPRGHLIQGADGALSFGRNTGFPLIAKPDSGVGANDTWCIRTPLELDNFLKQPRQGYILEEFIPGVIQTFDGLSDARAQPLYCSSLQYTGVMDMVADKQDTFYFTHRRIPDDVLQAGTELLQAFQVRMRFFHFEFFRTPDGRLVALEVNMRPAGWLTIDMFNYASDIDLYRTWAEVISGASPELHYSRPFHCGYAGRKSHRRYIHTHEQILTRCGEKLAAHQPMDRVFHTAMGDYAYLLRSPDLDEILELAAFIHARE
jgi:hypothetical protein